MSDNKNKYKQSLKAIKEVADKWMPIVMRNSVEKHITTGRALKAENYPGAEQYGDDEKVILNFPVQIYMNHYRAIKEAWFKGGYPEVNKYFEKVAAGMRKSHAAEENTTK